MVKGDGEDDGATKKFGDPASLENNHKGLDAEKLMHRLPPEERRVCSYIALIMHTLVYCPAARAIIFSAPVELSSSLNLPGMLRPYLQWGDERLPLPR